MMIPGQMDTETGRSHIVEFVRAAGGWVSSRVLFREVLPVVGLKHKAFQNDLRWLVNAGLLERRHSVDRAFARSGLPDCPGVPLIEYRAAGKAPLSG